MSNKKKETKETGSKTTPKKRNPRSKKASAPKTATKAQIQDDKVSKLTHDLKLEKDKVTNAVEEITLLRGEVIESENKFRALKDTLSKEPTKFWDKTRAWYQGLTPLYKTLTQAGIFIVNLFAFWGLYMLFLVINNWITVGDLNYAITPFAYTAPLLITSMLAAVAWVFETVWLMDSFNLKEESK